MSPLEPSTPLRVLLVEDYPDLADVTAELLREERLDVQVALSGRDALEIARAFRPQLVLCDLNLPDMTGLDVIRELQSNPATEDSYVAILTAIREQELPQQRDVRHVRVDAFVSKPITPRAIRTMLETLATRPVGNPSLQK
jgi:two-component system, OmpR family, alkaline phosphatase synthesis response regulator PhoP